MLNAAPSEGSRVVTRPFGLLLFKNDSARPRRIQVLLLCDGPETLSASWLREVYGCMASRRALCNALGSAEGSRGRAVTWFTLVEKSSSKKKENASPRLNNTTPSRDRLTLYAL